jgi:hypothetical protein
MSMDGHREADLLAAPPAEAIARLRSRSLAVGGIGLVLSALGFVLRGDIFWQSYLIAYYFWIGLTIGSMAVLMVQYLSGGAWGLVGRRVFEAATRTLPLMAVLFIPIVLKMQTLYSWARPGAAADPIIQSKAAYLNPTFFVVRAVLYFAIWGALIFVLNKWSREQDQQPTRLPGPQDRRFRLVSAPGLVLYVLTITFMSVDWVMSLDPHWWSTIFGVITLGGHGLATLAFTLLVLSVLVQYRPLAGVVGTEQVHDLSKLMFAFVLLWAYFNVSQLIIIWSANLPEEIPFYLDRFRGPWEWVSVLVLVGQFVLPFLLLLSRGLKRSTAAVRWVALLIIVMRVVDIAWTIAPAFRRDGLTLSWVDFGVTMGMGGLWLLYFCRNLAGRAILPAHDPYFKEAMAHGGH